MKYVQKHILSVVEKQIFYHKSNCAEEASVFCFDICWKIKRKIFLHDKTSVVFCADTDLCGWWRTEFLVSRWAPSSRALSTVLSRWSSMLLSAVSPPLNNNQTNFKAKPISECKKDSHLLWGAIVFPDWDGLISEMEMRFGEYESIIFQVLTISSTLSAIFSSDPGRSSFPRTSWMWRARLTLVIATTRARSVTSPDVSMSWNSSGDRTRKARGDVGGSHTCCSQELLRNWLLLFEFGGPLSPVSCGGDNLPWSNICLPASGRRPPGDLKNDANIQREMGNRIKEVC